jgi:hypothetical protein
MWISFSSVSTIVPLLASWLVLLKCLYTVLHYDTSSLAFSHHNTLFNPDSFSSYRLRYRAAFFSLSPLLIIIPSINILVLQTIYSFLSRLFFYFTLPPPQPILYGSPDHSWHYYTSRRSLRLMTGT